MVLECLAPRTMKISNLPTPFSKGGLPACPFLPAGRGRQGGFGKLLSNQIYILQQNLSTATGEISLDSRISLTPSLSPAGEKG
jgi:hypothetical protein